MKTIGGNIRLRRDGMSIKELERLTGIDRTTLSKLENNKWTPGIATLEKIAKALNCQVRDFLPEKECGDQVRKEEDNEVCIDQEVVMESTLQKVFEFEGSKVRTMTDIQGNPWFVAKEICEYFGDSHYLRTIGKLAEDEKGMTHMDTPGGKQAMTIVNESGLYSLLFQMQPQKGTNSEIAIKRIEQLKKFRRWVTSEVLPAIRKTGKYEVTPQLPDFSNPAIAARAWAEQWEKRQLAEGKIEELKPKAAFADAVNDSSNSMDLGTFAKILGTGRTRLFEWLREQGFLMAGGTKPYQRYIDNGWFVVIETTFTRGDETQTYGKTQICGKGQLAVEKLWREQHKEVA